MPSENSSSTSLFKYIPVLFTVGKQVMNIARTPH